MYRRPLPCQNACTSLYTSSNPGRSGVKQCCSAEMSIKTVPRIPGPFKPSKMNMKESVKYNNQQAVAHYVRVMFIPLSRHFVTIIVDETNFKHSWQFYFVRLIFCAKFLRILGAVLVRITNACRFIALPVVHTPLQSRLIHLYKAARLVQLVARAAWRSRVQFPG